MSMLLTKEAKVRKIQCFEPSAGPKKPPILLWIPNTRHH